MTVRTVTIYEVSNAYVSSGSATSILNIGYMTINDGDGQLDATLAADAGGDQTISTSFGDASSYNFQYNDTTNIGGTVETIKTFQLTIGGVTRSFVMNDTTGSIPGAQVGDSVNLQSYVSYTPVQYNNIPCFAAGTMIRTKGGESAVENLQAGDLVWTRDHGFQPLRWAGRAELSRRDLLARPHLAPITLRRGALGPDMPAADLTLSPQHRVLLRGWELELTLGVEEAFAAAKYLLGRAGVTRDTACEGISYHHLLFDHHEVIESNGLLSESFLAGETIRKGMDEAQLSELDDLFPGFLHGATSARNTPARPILSQHEVVVLERLAA